VNEAVIYARTSTDDQELGLDKQVDKLKEFADSQGYEVSKVFSNHISGMKEVVDGTGISLGNRPELHKCFLHTQCEEVSKLLVYNPSRLARRMRTELVLEKVFENYGVEIEYFDVSDSWIGKQISTLIYEFEVRQTRERTKKGLEQKDDDEWKGRPPTGFKTVEMHNKLEPEDWLKDLLDAYNQYLTTEKSRSDVAEDYRDEVTPARMRSIEKNVENDVPEFHKVKGRRFY
jgi:DNA invertase Pin-like site-specific DNA recombinase